MKAWVQISQMVDVRGEWSNRGEGKTGQEYAVPFPFHSRYAVYPFFLFTFLVHNVQGSLIGMRPMQSTPDPNP